MFTLDYNLIIISVNERLIRPSSMHHHGLGAHRFVIVKRQYERTQSTAEDVLNGRL